MSRPTPQQRLIEQLLRERGVGRHALFLTQREGTILPNGLEAVSGFVMDRRGTVHSFWLSWDAERSEPTLAPFSPVEEPDEEFADDVEYARARRGLGLD